MSSTQVLAGPTFVFTVYCLTPILASSIVATTLQLAAVHLRSTTSDIHTSTSRGPPPCQYPVYQYVRDLSGPCGLRISASNEEFPVNSPSCSLGYWTDTYLKAHGYDSSSIDYISTAFFKSDSLDKFIELLCTKGMVVAEVAWLWELTTACQR
jgi:hypothetical protein